MIKITVIKSEVSYYGSIPKCSKIINVHPETIKRWIREDKKVVYKNDCIVYLKAEKL